MAVVNKPKATSSPRNFTGTDFVLKPEVEKKINCDFTGEMKKGSQFGSAIFKVLTEPHQKHTNNFSCEDVLWMENKYGRHREDCPHVGFMSAEACCKPKEKK